jgi:Sulfotransferase domain
MASAFGQASDGAQTERSSTEGLPNVLVIGAMKAGTTTLHAWLSQHPEIAMSTIKEINYFVSDRTDRDPAWYARHFDSRAPFRGESSTSYTKFPQRPGVPQRIHALLPDARLIYVLRDPIERTVSHYLHAVQRGREHRSLTEALAVLEDNLYVDPSRYHLQLEQYWPYYPPTRILLLTTSELHRSPGAALGRVTAFLGAEPFQFETERLENVSDRRGQDTALGRLIESYPAKRIGRRLPRSAVKLAKRLNVTMSRRIGRPGLDPASRIRLCEYLSDDVTRLRNATGLSFDDWSL